MTAAPEQPIHEWEPAYSLDQEIARARKEMGEARWAELEAEWEAGEDA